MAGEVEKIAKMLNEESAEKRHAAAVVLGELKAKKPEVFTGLKGLLTSGVPALEAAGANALEKIGAKKGFNNSAKATLTATSVSKNVPRSSFTDISVPCIATPSLLTR